MPSAQSKRVKNTRIERHFWFGSEAWPLDDTNRKPDTPKEHTKGWRLYVRNKEGQPELGVWLKKVSFKIFHTYKDPVRVVESPPFEIEETGWGGFAVEIRLFFATESGWKPEYKSHFLQLEEYGDDENMKKQKDAKLVRSEEMETVMFDEPTEAFYNLMTDMDLNFPPKKGKGKGKAKATSSQSNEVGSVELSQSDREQEAQHLEMIATANNQIDYMLNAEKEKIDAVQKRLAELRSRR